MVKQHIFAIWIQPNNCTVTAFEAGEISAKNCILKNNLEKGVKHCHYFCEFETVKCEDLYIVSEDMRASNTSNLPKLCEIYMT